MSKYKFTMLRTAQGHPAASCRQRRRNAGLIPFRLVLQALSSLVVDGGWEGRRRRQAEGIAAAKASGVRFGREPSPLPEDFPEIYEQWRNGQLSTSEAAKRCGMPHSTFRYRAMIFEKGT